MPGGYSHVKYQFPKANPLPGYIENFYLPAAFENRTQLIIIDPEVEKDPRTGKEYLTRFKAYLYNRGDLKCWTDFGIKAPMSEKDSVTNLL